MNRRLEADLNIIMPQIRHFENDTWTSIPFNTANFGYPMAIGTEAARYLEVYLQITF